jgi:hypothetical protein
MSIILAAIALYALIGLAFAVPFVIVGAGRVDPVAKGAPLTFRLAILPGSAALWPLLLVKWRAARGGRGSAGAAP